MDIIGFIYEALKDIGIPIQEGWYDQNINKTHITYFERLETPKDFSDDETTSIEHNIQLDIWSKDSLEASKLSKKIKSILHEKDFIFDEGMSFFETDTKIFHKAMRFNFLEDLDN